MVLSLSCQGKLLHCTHCTDEHREARALSHALRTAATHQSVCVRPLLWVCVSPPRAPKPMKAVPWLSALTTWAEAVRQMVLVSCFSIILYFPWL